MSKIKYQKPFLALLSDFTSIRKSIVFVKDGDKVTIENIDSQNKVQYVLSSDKDAFEFSGDKFAIYDYPYFYQLLNSFKQTGIEQFDDHLIMSDEVQNNELRSKSRSLRYGMSDSDSVNIATNEVDFSNDATLVLSKEILETISKVIGNFGFDTVRFSIKEDKVDVSVFGAKNKNKKYENSFDLKETSTKNFKIEVPSDSFKMIPKKNYEASFSDECVRLTNTDKYDLTLYLKKK